MLERGNPVVSLLVTVVLLAIIVIGTLTLAGHKWPQAPLHYQSKSPGISWDFSGHATP